MTREIICLFLFSKWGSHYFHNLLLLTLNLKKNHKFSHQQIGFSPRMHDRKNNKATQIILLISRPYHLRSENASSSFGCPVLLGGRCCVLDFGVGVVIPLLTWPPGMGVGFVIPWLPRMGREVVIPWLMRLPLPEVGLVFLIGDAFPVGLECP